jgi:4-hydroxybenzoate polyprenyltransferase
VVLLGLFAATGLAEAGQGNQPELLAKALVAVAAFLLFSVVVNDLADEAIDRVNLPGDLRRPLAAGICGRREFVVVGVTAGVIALAASALLHRPAVLVVLGGLALSAGYSLRPIRVADRGAVASLLLPACYVAVPYLLGVFAVRGYVTPADVTLLAALYTGFIGRIVLKDFRDVRGDALFGKRTFLVRHGRRRTCCFSALCWTAGSVMLAGVRGFNVTLAAALVVHLAIALGLLAALSVERGARRDESLISAVAIVGRGTIVTIFAHLSMTDARWSGMAYGACMIVLTAVVAGGAQTMARRGPTSRLTVPVSWALREHPHRSQGRLWSSDGPARAVPPPSQACDRPRPAERARPVGCGP